MRLVLGMAIASLAATAAFAQSGTPAETPPPTQSSPASPQSSSDAGVSVDVGKLVKGLIKAVRKPPPKPAAPLESSASAQTDGAVAGEAAPVEPLTPVETTIVSPVTATAAPIAAPNPRSEPKADLAPTRPTETPFMPRVETAPRPASELPNAPATAPSDPVRPTQVEPLPRAKPDAVASARVPDPAAPTLGEDPSPAWPLMLLAAIAIAIAAAVGGRLLHRRRLLSRTRAALALSSRLELPDDRVPPVPLELAGPPISIRTRLETVSAHG
jgi:hypothetical protein